MATRLKLFDSYGAEMYGLACRLSGSPALAAVIVRRVFSEVSGSLGPRTADALCRQVIDEARAAYKTIKSDADPSSLEWALDQLPEAQRTNWILHKLEGRSCEDIARLVGITPGACRTSVWRARVEIQRLYEKLAADVIPAARANVPVPPPGLRASLGGHTRSLRRVRFAGAAAVAAAVAAVLVVQGARADRSELLFLPTAPPRGATITVMYQPAGQFADQDSLVLRGRFRKANQLQPDPNVRPERVTVLRRRGRAFHGQFTLRDSVVFGAFAVEDLDAASVDSRGERLWTIRTYEGDVPEYAAYAQHGHDIIGRHWEEYYRIAQEAVDAYPASPNAWWILASGELLFFGDSVVARHRAQFDGLARTFAARRDTSIDDIAGMYWYARVIGSLAAPWEGALGRKAPLHRWVVQAQTLSALPRGLAALDSLWDTGTSSRFLAQQGFTTAVRQGNIDGIRRWGYRLMALDSVEEPFVAREFAKHESLVEEGISALRVYADRLSTESIRALTETRVAHASHASDLRRPVLLALSSAIIESGRDTVRAHRVLDSAVARGWDRSTFQAAADLYQRLGDTTKAERMRSWVTVDPQTVDPALMPEGVHAQARAEMMRRTLASSIDRPIDAGVLSFVDPGVVTVLALWSPVGLTSQRPQLERTRRGISDVGGHLVIVENGTHLLAALQTWRLPTYAVIDTRNRLRFLHHDPGRLVRQVLSLASESPPVVD